MSDDAQSVSLRDHLESLIAHEHTLNETRHTASQEAVAQFRTTTESRFGGVNEFRATLTDQAGTFATREALESAVREIAALSNRLGALEARLLASGGVLLFVIALASVVVIWFHK